MLHTHSVNKFGLVRRKVHGLNARASVVAVCLPELAEAVTDTVHTTLHYNLCTRPIPMQLFPIDFD